MQSRKLGLGVAFACLALLLTSCIEVKGEMSINSAARLNGEITYTIDKSLASASGISTLSELNKQATQQSESDLGFCKDVPFTEDASNYIFKCPLKDALSQTGDLTANVVGRNIVFKYKGNLDSTSTDTNRADFGSVSLLVRFIDPIISYTENKRGLVQKVDALTYRISGYATEPMDIEIRADCSSRCGVSNSVPAPSPSRTSNPIDAAAAAVDAANKATDAANKAAAAASAAVEAANKAAEEAAAKAAAEQKLASASTKTAKPQIPVAAAKLPSAYEAKLKLATKVKFGQPIPLAVANCNIVKVKGKFTERCTYEKFVITVNSFKFFDRRTSIQVENSTYAIDLRLENYSSQERGLDIGEFLKCKSSRSNSDFYGDGIDPQGIPAKSQDSGVVIASFPDDIQSNKCESPVLWIQLSNSVDWKDKKLAAELKKKKLVGAAYIPLTTQMLVSP